MICFQFHIANLAHEGMFWMSFYLKSLDVFWTVQEDPSHKGSKWHGRWANDGLFYDPNSSLLCADVKNHLKHFGLVYWDEDKNLDRIRVTKELVNNAEVQLIGYGNSL